jgi:hypothetical protein
MRWDSRLISSPRPPSQPSANAAALNGRLPADMRVTGAEDVAEDFDARRSAVGKLYRYWDRRPQRHVPYFLRATPGALRERDDAAAMRARSAPLRGGARLRRVLVRVRSPRRVHRAPRPQGHGPRSAGPHRYRRPGAELPLQDGAPDGGKPGRGGSQPARRAWIADALASGRRDAAAPPRPPKGSSSWRVCSTTTESSTKPAFGAKIRRRPASPWEGGGEN